MKIGDKVVVKAVNMPDELIGKTGTIIAERIPNSQWAMLCGITKWEIKFDEPVHVGGACFSVCTIPEHGLALLTEGFA